jgi:hypothetical protein
MLPISEPSKRASSFGTAGLIHDKAKRHWVSGIFPCCGREDVSLVNIWIALWWFYLLAWSAPFEFFFSQLNRTLCEFETPATEHPMARFQPAGRPEGTSDPGLPERDQAANWLRDVGPPPQTWPTKFTGPAARGGAIYGKRHPVHLATSTRL